jgi:hypothetical protein
VNGRQTRKQLQSNKHNDSSLLKHVGGHSFYTWIECQ